MVSTDGEDEHNCLTASPISPCKTISYVINGGRAVVCMNGTFNNVSEVIVIDNNTYVSNASEIIIGCISCMFDTSIMVLSSSLGEASHVKIVDFTIKDSSIELGNVHVTFKNVIFEQVMIQDREMVPHQLYIEQSSLSCSSPRACGLLLLNSSVVKCVIMNSHLNGFKLDLNVREILLVINDTVIVNPAINVKVYSNTFLRIPSFIQFDKLTVNPQTAVRDTTSIRDKRSIGPVILNSAIVLLLTNPYLSISRCNFYQTHIMISANKEEFDQAYFWAAISNTKFVNSYYEGDGGALSVTSQVAHSRLHVSSCHFINNTAIKGMSKSKGYGGGISIRSDSLEVEIKDSLFLNNKAEDAGLDLYTSAGVTVSLINCSFIYSIDPSNPIQEALVLIAESITHFEGNIRVTNTKPESYVGPIDILYITSGQSLNIEIICPRWYRHIVQYNSLSTDGNAIKDIRYECNPCSDNYYTTSGSIHILSSSTNGNTSSIESQNSDQANNACIECPYGAVCTGNNVIPRPNYWGHWYGDKLEFVQCPVGYCCSGSNSSICSSYDYCAGNRTGILCGACREGFSVSILTGTCTPDSQCGGDQWFWLFALLSAMAYALWYTLKDDIVALFFAMVNYVKHLCIRSNSKISALPDERVQSNTSNADNDSLCADQSSQISLAEDDEEEDEDKAYFDIVTYYVQMAAVIMIQIEFSDAQKSSSFLDKIVDNIARFLNFELTQMSFDVCPIMGLTTLGKHLYALFFLIGIYICWALIFSFILIVILIMQRRNKMERVKHNLKSFKMKCVRGIVEIIKYTYAGFCGLIFMSLACSKLGKDYVWWYDGTNVCLESWQIIAVIFAAFYAFPFPFVLVFGLRKLKRNEISAAMFIRCCLCPLAALCILFIQNAMKPNKMDSDRLKLPESSETVISVLQGPYRDDGQNLTLYWEAMISIRRLLITGMTLLGSASARA